MGKKSVWAFLFYFFAAVLAFVYLLFPGEKMGHRLSDLVNRSLGAGTVSVGRLSLQPPLKMVGTPVSIDFMDLRNQQSLVVDRLTFRPVWSSVFSSIPQLTFDADLYGGTASGVVDLSLFLPVNGTVPGGARQMRVRFADIAVKRFHYKTADADVSISLDAGGTLTLTQTGARSVEGTGKIILSNCSIETNQDIPMLPEMKKFKFSTVTLPFQFKNNRLELEEGRAVGPEMNVELSGNIIPVSLSAKSRLNLTGYLQPDAAFLAQLPASVSKMLKKFKGKGLRFRITGSPDRPRVTL